MSAFRSTSSKPKSVLALTALADRTGRKLLALGLGGAWGWKGKVGIRETATGERVPEHAAIPDLTICRDGRKTYVLLDANCVSNPQVQAARVALIRQLRKQGADVGVLNLPASSKDKNWNGPDDYLSVCGDEAMSKVIDDYVDGIGLLEDLVSYFREYVRVGEDEYVVLSPWVLHSDCGKTLLLEVAELVVPRPMLVSDCTEASFARFSRAFPKNTHKTIGIYRDWAAAGLSRLKTRFVVSAEKASASTIHRFPA